MVPDSLRRFVKERPAAAMAGATFALAALTLLPFLGSYGLWDPHEITIADQARSAAPSLRDPPLTLWLIRMSIKAFGTSELAARLPLALLGIAGALATYALGARLRRPRAGLLAAVALLSSPLFVFQARQLTSSMAVVTSGALAFLGLVGLAWPGESRLPRRTQRGVDFGLAQLGLWTGYYSGGLLIGVFLPLATVALALAMSLRGGPDSEPAPERRRWRLFWTLVYGGLALVAAVVVFSQIYDVVPAQPGQWGISGKTLAVVHKYLPLVGGTPRTGEVPAEATFDYVLNQVCFGMFPWSALAPIAVLRLALGRKRDRAAWGGLVVLAWCLLSYLLAALWMRRMGEIRFPGMVAIALAAGFFLDDLLPGRQPVDGERETPLAGRVLPVAALFVLIAGLQLARDCLEFPDELAGVHLLANVKFPTELNLMPVVLGFGALFSIAAASGLSFNETGQPSWLPRRSIRLAGLWGAVGVSALFGLFLSIVYTPSLSQHFSYKNLFQSYFEHRKGAEPLGVMGIPGSGPEYYAHGPFQRLGSVPELLTFLQKDERVFAISPADKLCSIHQNAASGQHTYHVLDNRNSRFLLLTNQLLPGETDENPLTTAFRKTPPERFARDVTANFEDKLELLGVDMPDAVDHGDIFTITLWYRVKARVSTNYKVFLHFDGFGVRFQGDHDPIGGRCGTSFWQVGDIIADSYQVQAGEITHPRGNYTAYMGFFTGSAGQWKNMTVLTPNHDSNNRVSLGTLRVR